MLGSSILDVAIGMAFIYLLLSLIASTIQEWISAVVQARAANLAFGIRSLFSGGTLANGKPLVDLLYTHGLVRGLYQDPELDLPRSETHPTKLAKLLDEGWAPLVGGVRAVRDGLLKGARLLLRIRHNPPMEGVSDPYLLPAYIPARTFAITMIDILNPDKDNGKPALQNIEDNLMALCKDACLTDSTKPHKAAEAMLALLANAKTAEDAADKFRCNLENWYNDAMDRVSGWYKKYTQKILLVIGLVLAIVFNVDSIQVGRTLWFDKDARQGLINAANTYVANNTPTSQKKVGGDTGDTQSIADGKGKQPPAGSVGGGEPLDVKKLTTHLKTTVDAFNTVSADNLLPVGWRNRASYYWDVLHHPSRENVVRTLERIPGWLITAFALSFGAPFWFDTLNKFMVVRSTVKPQEKSKNEGSKDG